MKLSQNFLWKLIKPRAHEFVSIVRKIIVSVLFQKKKTRNFFFILNYLEYLVKGCTPEKIWFRLQHLIQSLDTYLQEGDTRINKQIN